jgi:hypothetical protein
MINIFGMKDLVLIVKAFTAVCKNDGTYRGFSLNQEILEICQNLGPAQL